MVLYTSYIAEQEQIHTSAICIIFNFFILRKFSNYNGVFGCSNIKSLFVLSKNILNTNFKLQFTCIYVMQGPPAKYMNLDA